ncbi:hypothetical protein WA158_001165 [Blastocystis sp. Blastoise]
MPHSFGYRARTRSMFKRDFRDHGVIPLSTYMRNYKVGDYVDIKANGSIHKGMPQKGYHGRTGIVFDVTKTSVGVIVNKIVRNRQLKKRIHVRVDHIRPSTCRIGHIQRVKENDLKKVEAKKTGVKVCLKRTPALPRDGCIVVPKEVITVHPLPYEVLA